jgi:hypothetical protein
LCCRGPGVVCDIGASFSWSIFGCGEDNAEDRLQRECPALGRVTGEAADNEGRLQIERADGRPAQRAWSRSGSGSGNACGSGGGSEWYGGGS